MPCWISRLLCCFKHSNSDDNTNLDPQGANSSVQLVSIQPTITSPSPPFRRAISLAEVDSLSMNPTRVPPNRTITHSTSSYCANNPPGYVNLHHLVVLKRQLEQ
ncbi:unnamed protein product [Orchesella dallaii]|uniref:Uncharacterized protein n=1 Tax=Orchesella dallaii TaxID=48710 RepID=A0ABP1RGG0_9HEXA